FAADVVRRRLAVVELALGAFPVPERYQRYLGYLFVLIIQFGSANSACGATLDGRKVDFPEFAESSRPPFTRSTAASPAHFGQTPPAASASASSSSQHSAARSIMPAGISGSTSASLSERHRCCWMMLTRKFGKATLHRDPSDVRVSLDRASRVRTLAVRPITIVRMRAPEGCPSASICGASSVRIVGSMFGVKLGRYEGGAPHGGVGCRGRGSAAVTCSCRSCREGHHPRTAPPSCCRCSATSARWGTSPA